MNVNNAHVACDDDLLHRPTELMRYDRTCTLLMRYFIHQLETGNKKGRKNYFIGGGVDGGRASRSKRQLDL